MRKFILFLSVATVLVIVLNSCIKKGNRVDSGCDCDTDSIYHRAYYNNFGGYSSYDASLEFITRNNQNAWFVDVNIPNTNYGALLKVCNTDLPAIRAIIDTSKRIYGIPVKFAGRLKRICASEDQTFGFGALPETICSYLTIDSLVKQ